MVGNNGRDMTYKECQDYVNALAPKAPASLTKQFTNVDVPNTSRFKKSYFWIHSKILFRTPISIFEKVRRVPTCDCEAEIQDLKTLIDEQAAKISLLEDRVNRFVDDYNKNSNWNASNLFAPSPIYIKWIMHTKKSIALDYLIKILLHKIIINCLYRYEPIFSVYSQFEFHTVSTTHLR